MQGRRSGLGSFTMHTCELKSGGQSASDTANYEPDPRAAFTPEKDGRALRGRTGEFSKEERGEI